jgi:DNA-binding response OmpR family regulator
MKSILLVDDETIICAEFKRTLRRFGFHVEAAHTLEAALRSIRKAQFDAILVEFNLRSERAAHPRTGNGLRLIHQLRAAQTKAPVLMFTAMEGEPYKTVSLEAGADDFILKTDGIRRLLTRLQTRIDQNAPESGRELAHRFGRNASKPRKAVRAAVLAR